MRALDQVDVNIKPQKPLHEKPKKQAAGNEQLKRRLDASEEEVVELRQQKKDLQDQLNKQSRSFDDDLSEVTSEYELFSPSELSARTDVNLADAYRALYASFKSAIGGLRKSRQSLKFYQQREEAIDRCLNKDQFKIFRNNQDVYFRRIDKEMFEKRARGDDNSCRMSTALEPDIGALSSGASIGRSQQHTGPESSNARGPRLGHSQISTLAGEETQTQPSWHQEPILHTQSREQYRSADIVKSSPRRCLGEFIAIPSTQSTFPQDSGVASPMTKRRRLSCHSDQNSAGDSAISQSPEDDADNKLSVKREPLQELLGDIKVPAFRLQNKPSEQLHSRQGDWALQDADNEERSERFSSKYDGSCRSARNEKDVSPISLGLQNDFDDPTNGTSKRAWNEAQSTTEIATTPLRSRPLHSLGVKDFKINPDRNEGLDYAFCQVIRNKARRQCLESCMRPECCGRHFRNMAIMRPVDEENLAFTGLDKFDREALLRNAGADTDEALADHFDKLPMSLRKEKLLDARASYYASRFARHRIDYARAPSPPGFWETDMPSTPAVPRQRNIVNPAEQERIKQMYEEAIRPYGKWKFADE